jgi:Sugar-transfer associated ATP-grasp
MLSIIAVLAGATHLAGTGPDAGAAEPLGRMARRIFAIQQRSPYRQIHTHFRKNFWVRFSWLHNLRRAWSYAGRNMRAVRRERGVTRTRQTADLLRLAFVHRIDPATYYALHLYDIGMNEAEYYVGRYETKNGLFSLLCELRRKESGFGLTLSEKALFSRICRDAGLPIVPVIAVVANGIWTPVDAAPGALDCDLFVKTVRGKGAIGAAAYHFAAGRYQTKDGGTLSPEELNARLAEGSRQRPLLVTRKIGNHPEIADLAGDSLITFRVWTCIDLSGQPVVTHGMLRVLAKLEPGWSIKDELGAAIDLESGRLGPFCSDINLMPDAWWDRHPETGAVVAGRVIENWPALAELAVAAHRVFNGRIVIGWDLALTPEGPMMIEGNSDADTHFLQRVHRQTIGRSPLEPLLRHHLKAAERLLAEGSSALS